MDKEKSVRKSFKEVFGGDLIRVDVCDDVAFCYDEKLNYSCTITKRGVKKNSWRINN